MRFQTLNSVMSWAICLSICLYCYTNIVISRTKIMTVYILNVQATHTSRRIISAIQTLTFKSLAVLYVPQGLTFKNSTWRLLCVECFVQISEQPATFALYIINWLAFITLVESVYCAVRTYSLNKADYVSSLKGSVRKINFICELTGYF